MLAHSRSALLLCVALVAVLWLAPTPARADFNVAYSSVVEIRPTVAHDSGRNQFAVASIDETSPGTGPVAVRFFDANGIPVGSPLQPFGTTPAISRPYIAYSPGWQEYVVVAALPRGSGTDEFALRRIDAVTKTLIGSGWLPLFTDCSWARLADGTQVPAGISSLRVTWNRLLGQYLITAQLEGAAGMEGVWGQIISADGTMVRSSFRITTTCAPQVHAVDHAPIATSLSGGRYLVVWQCADEIEAKLLDASGFDVVPDLPLDQGHPEGQSGYPDVAFGTIEGTDQFLVVWSDGDNCRPGTSWCPDPLDQHTGVWGTYIDPWRTTYDPPNPDNVPFPISGIASHLADFHYNVPRVASNEDADAFFVAWVERPANDPMNEPQRCSHIRGDRVDRLSHPNNPDVILSDVDCTCAPKPTGPDFCASPQDPRVPDVAPLGPWSAVAVWQSSYPPNPVDQDLWGDTWGYAPPANDDHSTAEPLTGSGDAACSLVGATNDGDASCGNSLASPDVWYSFTAPQPGQLRVTTCGSHDLHGVDTGADTVLSLHDGGGVELPGACNDDWPSGPVPDACTATDLGIGRDSALLRTLTASETVWVRVSRYGGTLGGECRLHASYAASAAGRVARDALFPGWPLTLQKAAGGDIRLDWQGSCADTDSDYEVYEGQLGRWTTHVPRFCTTGGAWTKTFTPASGNRYYLIVPRTQLAEGSYGLDSHGVERPPSSDACLPQTVRSCD